MKEEGQNLGGCTGKKKNQKNWERGEGSSHCCPEWLLCCVSRAWSLNNNSERAGDRGKVLHSSSSLQARGFQRGGRSDTLQNGFGYTGGERERIKPVFVVFSQWTDWEGEGKCSRGQNHRQGAVGVPPPAREGGQDRIG